MTINNFIKLIEYCEFEICFNERYFIRPSHEIRYGLKMKKITKDLAFQNRCLLATVRN